MKDVQELINKWDEYIRLRNPFLFGEEEISLNDFAELAEDTFEYFKYVKENYIFVEKAADSFATLKFLELLSSVSEYNNYDNAEDESVNYAFTITCLIAEQLKHYLIYRHDYHYENGKRFLLENETDGMGTFLIYREDFPFYDDATDEELNKTYKYNVHEKDFSEILELTKSLR